MTWHEEREAAKQALTDRLVEVFPGSTRCTLAAVAESLATDYEIATLVQELAVNDGDPSQDIVQLSKAMNSLQRAEQQIAAVKYYGSYALVRTSGDQAVEMNRIDSAISNRSKLVDHIKGLRAWLEEALSITPESADSNARIFGNDFSWGEGRPAARKGVAASLARRCGDQYEALTGSKVTLTTNTQTNEASGQFLDMISEVFDHFDVDGSAEGWARSEYEIRRERRTVPRTKA